MQEKKRGTRLSLQKLRNDFALIRNLKILLDEISETNLSQLKTYTGLTDVLTEIQSTIKKITYTEWENLTNPILEKITEINIFRTSGLIRINKLTAEYSIYIKRSSV